MGYAIIVVTYLVVALLAATRTGPAESDGAVRVHLP